MLKEPLAVIGIGCRLPGGVDSPVAFWDALLRGFNGIRDVPEDRWKHSRFHDTNPEKSGSGLLISAEAKWDLVVIFPGWRRGCR